MYKLAKWLAGKGGGVEGGSGYCKSWFNLTYSTRKPSHDRLHFRWRNSKQNASLAIAMALRWRHIFPLNEKTSTFVF